MYTALHGIGAFGAFLHVAGSVLIVYGQTMVKVAHCIEESSVAGSSWHIPQSQTTPKWRRPDGKWRLQRTGSKSYAAAGWSLFAIGNIMRFVSMRFAAQTVLSGLGSLQFVVIPVASRFLLGIKPQMSTGIGVVTVLLGNLFIISYGPPEVTFSLAQLRLQWTTPAMKGFLVVLGTLLAGLHLLWRHLHRLRRKAEAEAILRRDSSISKLAAGDGLPAIIGSSNDNDLTAGSNSNTSSNNDNQHLLATPSKPSAPPLGSFQLGDQESVNMFVAALLFSAVASFIGAWSVLFSKSLTYVVSSLPHSLFDWYSWFTAVAFLGSAAYWVRQSNKGLKLYPATLIMPLMQAFWMCMSVLEGMIYFDEMAALTPGALWMLSLGLLMALAGAVAMGLAGYFNEQPQLLALAMSPTAGTSAPDVESQRLLGINWHTHKYSGLPPVVHDDGDEMPLPRLGGISNVVQRDKVVKELNVVELSARDTHGTRRGQRISPPGVANVSMMGDNSNGDGDVEL